MKRVFLAVFVLAAALSGAVEAPKAAPVAARQYVYEAAFEKLLLSFHAADIEVALAPTNIAGKALTHFRQTIKATPFVERMRHLNVRSEALILSDGRTLCSATAIESGAEVVTESLAFAYSPTGTCQITSTRTKRGEQPVRREFTSPRPAFNALAAYQAVQSVEFSKVETGAVFPVSVLTEKGVAAAELRFDGREKVKTVKGEKVSCLVFCLLAGPVGARQPAARFFLADGEFRLPVRLDLELKFGRMKVLLKAR